MFAATEADFNKLRTADAPSAGRAGALKHRSRPRAFQTVLRGADEPAIFRGLPTLSAPPGGGGGRGGSRIVVDIERLLRSEFMALSRVQCAMH